MSAPPSLRRSVCSCSKGLKYDLDDLLSEIDRQTAALRLVVAERDAAGAWAIAALTRCAELNVELVEAARVP